MQTFMQILLTGIFFLPLLFWFLGEIKGRRKLRIASMVLWSVFLFFVIHELYGALEKRKYYCYYFSNIVQRELNNNNIQDVTNAMKSFNDRNNHDDFIEKVIEFEKYFEDK